MLRMVSVAALVECKEHVSRVQRVLSVGVIDGSSLTGSSVGLYAVDFLFVLAIGKDVVGFVTRLLLFQWWNNKYTSCDDKNGCLLRR